MMKLTVASFLRLGLNFGSHIGKTLKKIKRHIQRLFTNEMNDKSEIVKHCPSISPLTSDVNLNNF